MTLKASATVNTHNRPRYLEGCLRCLARQSISQADYEVIVVDNSSAPYSEDNQRIVDLIAAENPALRVRYIYDHVAGGLTHSRNLAVSEAATNVIVQADDDSLPCPEYIATAVISLSQQDVALIKGRMIAKYEDGEPDPQLIKTLVKQAHDGHILADLTCIDLGAKRVEIDPPLAYGSNCAFKQDFYLKAGGFGPDGFAAPFLYWNGTGEYHYAKAAPQLGYKIWYEPQMSADHIIPADRLKGDFFLARSFYYGIGGSFDLISQGHRPFSCAALKLFLWRLRLTAGHLRRRRFFDARREMQRIKGFLSHQFVCLIRADIVDFSRRTEWLTFDFSKMSPIGRPKTKSQW